MKLRQGFVSNSSSSSFVVIGEKVSLNEVCSDMKFDKPLMIIGEVVNEGQEYFEITEEFRELLREHKDNFKNYYDFVLEYKTAGDEVMQLKRAELPEEFSIFPFTADYHIASNDADSFFERYFELRRKKRNNQI